MNDIPISKPHANKALASSTGAFTICFAVWTIFSIIGLQIQQELQLSDAQFGLLAGTPILSGSISRVFLGSWADRYGGRKIFAGVMVCAALATFLMSLANSYVLLLLGALGVGLAGGAFSVGVSFVSAFYPPERQGTALGIFGAGNVGAAVTKLLAPMVMIALGWKGVAQIWAAALLVAALLFLLLTSEDPKSRERREKGKSQERGTDIAILKNPQVWRFSLYYFFVFGAFVALTLWLPHYLVDVYGLDIVTAGILAACYSIPASLFRIYGGYLSDRVGARAVLYATFAISVVCTFLLSYPPTDYVITGTRGAIRFHTEMALIPFVVVMFVLGFVMSLGKAAVFKHIPVYYPNHVGAVSGVVGMVGGLGGFVLPFAFGILADLTGIWTSCFALLFVLVTTALVWMHFAIRAMERGSVDAATAPELPELHGFGEPGLTPAAARTVTLVDWRPEDPDFWQATGRPIARRNLWVSTYCLLLSFAVWMVWSVVVSRLPTIGFAFTTSQLFWLAAIPGISGAIFRIFYAFLVPIFGGRLWTTLSTATLLIPAFGIGYAVQNPQTPFLIFLALALLCGFGGGNFASSVANISYFFPKAEKGNALAINSGLGNLGVSVMQALVPLVVTMGLFGVLGGGPQVAADGTAIWMQNAGFVWVPPILIGMAAAWFGMNDIASAKASFADQATIFGRRHTWVMCWLYTGTFGTFIGMSAGFPLLAKLVFPEVDALKLAFLGPLVGALSRAGSGWIADRVGGAKVTFWVFVCQALTTGGMIWFLNGHDFWGFFATVLLLFLISGVGNSSTFQMVPAIMRWEVDRAMPQADDETRLHQSERESAAVTGFISAIAAFGAFYIPKAYGSSIDATGGAVPALIAFLVFFVSCAAVTWYAYSGPYGILGDRALRDRSSNPRQERTA
ncbi:MFS transporter [Novosphingobium sp. BL-8H]|uniref:nitrate/nitrite transporter n=1 Tax=Novosphingobium sp. BL-8H TaxID=3127640 RepID=UPI003756C930